jgi:energy-coupling factor transport system permease protein
VRPLAGSPFTSATWWALGLAMMLAASLTHNVVLLASYCAIAVAAIILFATPGNRAGGLRIYGTMAVAVVALRLIFRVVFNTPFNGTDALNLPLVSIKILGSSITFLGPVSFASLGQGLEDGLRLAAIILGVATANSIANPRRLLRLAPSALYEFATAVAVALNLAPQLILSLRRVQRARNLRGSAKGLGNIGTLVIPVLEDAINRSLELAASMDSRGFGRRGVQSRQALIASRIAAGTSVFLLTLASYVLLTRPDSSLLAIGCAVLGVALLATSLRISSMHRIRTSLRVESQGLADHVALGVTTIGIILLAAAQLNPGLGWWH